MKITGLILSAGLSGRMNSFKPILTLHEKPLIVLITEKLLNICDGVVVVTGHKKEIVENTIAEYFNIKSNQVRTVFNNEYESGMFSSLKKGLSAVLDSDWIIYHFVDQPSLPQKFYYDFVEQICNGYNWIQPSHNKTKGHPIILHRSIFNLILNTNSNSSLKEISSSEAVIKKIWECDYPEVLQDLDTPDDIHNLYKTI